jgi:GNAT superfamily N-acetyltransferase
MNLRDQQEDVLPFSIRKGEVSDLEDIARLHRTDIGRELDLGRLSQYLADFPSVVAEATECGLIAFAFTTTFAPDILELANILVSNKWRNHGIGSQVLEKVEELAEERFSAIILVNSMLYSTFGKKRPAAAFYKRAGYENILQTSGSVVFSKSLL